jgi:hypothetical protein
MVISSLSSASGNRAWRLSFAAGTELRVEPDRGRSPPGILARAHA